MCPTSVSGIHPSWRINIRILLWSIQDKVERNPCQVNFVWNLKFRQGCSCNFDIWPKPHRHFFKEKTPVLLTPPWIQWYSNWYFWLPIIDLSTSCGSSILLHKYSWLLTNTYVIGRTRSTSTTNQNPPILKFIKQVKKWMDAILSVGRPYFGVILGTLAPFPLFANFCMMKSCIA